MSEPFAAHLGERPPATAASLVALALAALLAAAASAFEVVPWPVLILLPAAGLAIVAAPGLDRSTPLLALIAVISLFPVTTIGPAKDALGGHGSTLRSAFLLAVLAWSFFTYRGRIPAPPRVLRPLVSGLLVLAGLGAVAAIANVSPNQGLAALLAQLVGQPLVFAALLIAIPAYLRGGELARRRLLAAFSVGIIAQAGVIVLELTSGGAYDSLRGFTRAQGTIGADFVSALGMAGFFVGVATCVRWREGGKRAGSAALGLTTILASLVILVAAVARGGVIGVFIGGAYVLVSDPRLRRLAVPITALVAVVLVGSLLTPAGHLWTDRLGTGSVQSFDRPATWVSGARIGLDHPLTGIAEQDIEADLIDVRSYRQTPFGDSRVLPHNSWIIVLDEGGFGALAVVLLLTVSAFAAVRPPPGGRSTEERLYVAALIGMLAIAAINNVFRHPELMVPTLMLISLIAVRPHRMAPLQENDR